MSKPIFEKKNVLVTGGAGFIGSHLCEKLLKEAKVICLDDLSNSSPRNIDHLLQYADFEFIKHDINAPFHPDDFPELEKFKVGFQGLQEIYHLACPTSAKNFNDFRIQTLDANSLAMKNTLELAVKYSAKYLFASSAVVYGPASVDGKKISEDYQGITNQLSPRANYDEGKRFAETSVETYRQVYDLDAKIARIFRTYGPRLKLYDGQMITDFVIQALDGQDLIIYGDESFTTSLTYVMDIVDGLLRLMKAPPGVGPVNFGSDEAVKLADVAAMIVKMMDSKSKVRFEAPIQFMTPLALPDLSKARDLLGWLPLVRLEDGLRKTIDYSIAHKSALEM